MKSSNMTTIGWTTFISGLIALFSSISLIVSYITGSPSITRFSYALSALTLMLVIPLLVALSSIILNKHEIYTRIFQSLVVIGAVILIKARAQLVIGAEINTVFSDKTVLWEYLGAGLIGIAILTYALFNPSNPELKNSHVWVRAVVGVALSTYIFGLIFRDQFDQLAEGRMGITEVNPIVGFLFLTILLIYVIARPVWLLWSGRLFLKTKE